MKRTSVQSGPSSVRALFVLVVLALSSGTTGVHAQTPITGAIATDTVWSAAQGPYVLQGAVTIVSGASLSIRAGTLVQFGSDATLTVVDGALSALGTSAAPIVFTSVHDDGGTTPAEAGDWGPITFSSGTQGVRTRLSHAAVRYGKGVVVHSTSPRFDDVSFENNEGAAMAIDLAASPSGLRLSAAGNGINGIVVPAGVIEGDVEWSMKGIPYVVPQGIVDVGREPFKVWPRHAGMTVGETLTFEIRIPNPAPSGGQLVNLTSYMNTIAALSSPSITIPSGERIGEFQVVAVGHGWSRIDAVMSGTQHALHAEVMVAPAPSSAASNKAAGATPVEGGSK